MVNWKSRKTGDILLLLNGLVLMVLVNLFSADFFFRIDMTEEKRYSIKEQTKDVLSDLDETVYVEVYLEGDLNAGFRRFRKAIAETLEEFRIYSDNKVKFSFIDPSAAKGTKAQSEFMADLAAKGIQPKNVIENQNGQRIEKLIFPGAIVSYGTAERGVMLLKGNKARTAEEEINQSIEGIEFELVNAIYNLTSLDRKRIGLVTGHGELTGARAAAFHNTIAEVYDVTDVDLLSDDLSGIDAIVIAKPTGPFTETEKYKLDQFIVKGGRALMLIDRLEASMDSAAADGYFAFPYNLGLDDLLFKYGVRINNDLIQDQNSGVYPIVTGNQGSRPQVQLMPWPFFPLINRYADHPVTRNLDAVVTRFVSSIDTVKAEGVVKTPLMFTSQYSRTLTAPVSVSLNEMRRNLDKSAFNESFVPVAYLLEGQFTSLFKNRFLPDSVDGKSFVEQGQPSKIIVVADGDMVRNEVNPRTGQAQALGYDPFTNYTFANEDLLRNMLAYLTDENGLISTRNKEVKIRPLDRNKIADEKTKWQLINLLLPLIVLAAFGMARAVIRKRKYTRA
ncbi:MAG TPA: gliding motility-associated ABC transporter substrate-binding protein GldG [Chryseosolibacter sp.]|nr:gliding motility-associated ABC transporter substrate-binding protein GldG [Chryseosolibacter sp.]